MCLFIKSSSTVGIANDIAAPIESTAQAMPSVAPVLPTTTVNPSMSEVSTSTLKGYQ